MKTAVIHKVMCGYLNALYVCVCVCIQLCRYNYFE